MKKKFALFIITSVITLASCNKQKSFYWKGFEIFGENSALVQSENGYNKPTIDWTKVISNPGHSFVPLFITYDQNRFSAAAMNSQFVLNIVSEFETINPNLKVTSWRVESSAIQNIEGIWFDHEVRYSITDSMNLKPVVSILEPKGSPNKKLHDKYTVD